MQQTKQFNLTYLGKKDISVVAAKFIRQWHYFLKVPRVLSVSEALEVDVKSSLMAMNHPKIQQAKLFPLELFFSLQTIPRVIWSIIASL